MKIVYVHQHFTLPAESGGGRGWEFARRFALDGHEVTIVRGGVGPRKRVVDGVTVITINVRYENSMSFGRRLLSFTQFVIGSFRWVVSSRPNVVLASSTPLTVAIPAILATLPKRTKFVFEVRDLWPEVPIRLGVLESPVLIFFAKCLERLTYRRADAVVALSPYMANGVREVNSNVKVITIPNGCDLQLFDSEIRPAAYFRSIANVKDNERLVVYAGGFGYLYDLGWCVDLAARLQEDGIRFTLIGEGMSFDSLVAQAKSTGVYRDGMFLGRLPRKEVVGFLKAADVNISTLLDEPVLEGCSLNKVFDSMAAARPLVFNHRGWQAEEIEAEDAGWFLSRNLDRAVAVMRAALASKDEMDSRGRNSRRVAAESYDRDDQYRNYRDLLSTLAPVSTR